VTKMAMRTFAGIPVSEGIVIGKAFVYAENAPPEIPRYSIFEGDVPAERKRLQKALDKAANEIKTLLEDTGRQTKLGKEQADIFQAHLFMLEDVEFLEEIGDKLKQSLRNVEWVVQDMARELCQRLMQSPDPAFRERAADIADVSRRVIDSLLCVVRGPSSLAELDEDVIVVARDLMPSDTLLMNKARVKGIALDEGGKTSHTAIIARAFGIPAVLGLSNISRELRNGETLVLDGTAGVAIINPDKWTLDRHESAREKEDKRTDELGSIRDLPAQTTDGHRVALMANIGFPDEAENLLQYGAEGIGLYRSEFLFITPGKTAGEEAQYEAYSHALKTMGQLPVTIRTIDVGGDKLIPELQALGEKNPLLGWRAIRISLANPELFKVQLRALLRASVHGKLKIMFPLICCVEEVEQARAMLDEARAECKKKKQPFADNIEVGVMIEVPSAAVSADIIAEESDFFSIGTNDLIQYSLAVDRGNEKIHYLNDSHHPAVLRLIKRAIDAAHDKGIKASVCGELAGDPTATAILIGLGLDEFSMNAPSIPKIKEIIRGTSLKSCVALAAEAMRRRTSAEVRESVSAWMAKNFPKYEEQLRTANGTGKHGI